MTLGWEAADDRLAPGAEWYASQGWHILPCWGIVGGKCACGQTHEKPKDQGKHPHGRLTPSGAKEATTDVGVVRRWWGEDPEANIGVRCRESGFLVIDIDPRSNGHKSFLRLEELAEGEIPPTVEACTGMYSVAGEGSMQGRHLFYKVGAGERFKGDLRGDGLTGIEIKHNGYVLIAPSRHASGVTYEWREGCAPWEVEIAEAPEKLLGVLRKKGPAAGSGSVIYGTVEFAGEKINIDAILEEGILEGERATTLFKVTCALANRYPVDTEYGRASVKQLIRGINQKHVIPPLDWGTGGPDDFEPQCDNAINFVKDNPKTTVITPELQAYIDSAQAMITGTKGVPRDVLAGPAPGGTGEAVDAGVMLALPPDADDPLRAFGAHETDGIYKRTLTDTGNGRRLADYYGTTFKYSVGLGWHCWDGEYWMPDPGVQTTFERAKSLSQIVIREAATYPDKDKVEELGKWHMRCKANALIKNAIESASKDPRVDLPVQTWDSSDTLLGVMNGVVNLRTGDLLSGKPELFITRRAKVAYSPGMRNPRWDQFLDFATGGDKELQDWLQRAAGYTLTGLRDHDVMFLVYGLPGSGKNTFVEALVHLLDDYAYPLDAEMLMDRKLPSGQDLYHYAELRGKRMGWVDELPENELMKENAVKRLTGSGIIEARSPGEKPFKFFSKAKLWISTNHRPRIGDDAMWRRLRPIPFNSVPEKPDPSLKPYIFDPDGALPAVLSWAVDGAVKFLGSSMTDGLGMCTAVGEDLEKYRKNEDRLGQFLADETRVDTGTETPVRSLYMTYRAWCEERGEKPMTTIALIRKLTDRGEVVDGRGSMATLKHRALVMKTATATGGTEWNALLGSASRW